MQKLELYYFPGCPFCIKVLKFVERNKLNEDIILKNIHEDQAYKNELLDIGGKNQVPCLFIDGRPLYESNDIINWLKENML
ncbi:MAG: glutaredoxin family protein [Halanaerobiales bacterium]